MRLFTAHANSHGPISNRILHKPVQGDMPVVARLPPGDHFAQTCACSL